MDINTFLSRHSLTTETLKEIGLAVHDLAAIYRDYITLMPNLAIHGTHLAEYLRREPLVHSVRVRVKDPEHLLEKIIRKRREQPDRVITVQNYRDEIRDLIGLRAIHLVKEDWGAIHDYIIRNWGLAETPEANIREGDSRAWWAEYVKRGCIVKEKEAYRSVHYIIKSSPALEPLLAEIQVRTIFDEGWSELDHQIRYPNGTNNATLISFLLLLNRLTGAADELASGIRVLDTELAVRQTAANYAIEELKRRVHELALAEHEKKELQATIESLRKAIRDERLSMTQAVPRSETPLPFGIEGVGTVSNTMSNNGQQLGQAGYSFDFIPATQLVDRGGEQWYEPYFEGSGELTLLDPGITLSQQTFYWLHTDSSERLLVQIVSPILSFPPTPAIYRGRIPLDEDKAKRILQFINERKADDMPIDSP
jgi:putative GTP pyrophosphokinase